MSVKGYIFTSAQGKKTHDKHNTRMSDVKAILADFDFTNKRVYCPCDTAESAWVKYLRGRCRDLVFTNNDYHDNIALFKWADIIITNPPFSIYADFARHCMQYTGEAILITPSHSVFTFWVKNTDPRALRLLHYVRYFETGTGVSEVNAGAVYYYGGRQKMLSEVLF